MINLTVNGEAVQFEITNERMRRIAEAISETQRLIDREMRYLPENRNQENIDRWNAHIVKLAAAVA